MLHRPTPLPTAAGAAQVDHRSPPAEAAARLRRGERLLVTDSYRTGAEILAQLQRQLPLPPQSAPYAARQSAQAALRTAGLRLLAPIRDHRLALRGAQPIGFLKELYPTEPAFTLPFLQAQELHGAWRRYVDGVRLAVLGEKVHPFYGTYAPTRTEHLELFATWLRQHAGARERAIDVGTGCGVLALMLSRAGATDVRATDINPNAVESVSRERRRRDPQPPITPVCCDLLGDTSAPADLIVFNPPWMRGSADALLDQALYFDDDDLFARFFAQAEAALAPEGRVVVVFSNVITLVQPDIPHPIEAELAKGTFRLVQKLRRKIKPPPGPDGRRRRTKERVEVWELAR